MSNYDARVWEAKQAATNALMGLVGKDPRTTADDMARCIDDLNKAWDELTNCLVRQRTERDSQIRRLIDELAEVRNRTT